MKRQTVRMLWPMLLVASVLFAQADIPFLTGRVVDNANILTFETKDALSAQLKAHENSTGNQIAILTIPTLNGENIEDYANAVFNAWKLGQAGRDNGLLIVVAPNDRRLRIEVGYGLEATLTDGTAGQIIRSVMTPRFKTNDYDGGIREGINAVITVLAGGTLPEPVEETSQGDDFFKGPDMPLQARLLMGAFIFGIIGLFTFMGIVTPGVGWFLYVFLIPFWAMFPIVVVGGQGALVCLVTYIIGFPIAKLSVKRTKWYAKAKKEMKKKGSASIGGFRFTSGSSGGGWSSGGGGFSGGGGSSGGGGASGSW